jgi:hypothetical protein
MVQHRGIGGGGGMSLIIKGMDMPKKGVYHAVITFDGDSLGVRIPPSKKPFFSGRIVHMPTPHGRLIDADELMKKLERHRDMCGDIETQFGIDMAINILRNIPTIIEAENSSAIDDDVKKYCDYLKSETYDFCNRIENGEVNEE